MLVLRSLIQIHIIGKWKSQNQILTVKLQIQNFQPQQNASIINENSQYLDQMKQSQSVSY